MPFLFLLVPMVAFVSVIGWIASEFGAPPIVRLGFGATALVSVCAISFFMGGFGPSQELLLYQMSMGKVRELTSQGDVGRIKEAFQSADSNHSKTESYGGILWSAFSKEHTDSK